MLKLLISFVPFGFALGRISTIVLRKLINHISHIRKQKKVASLDSSSDKLIWTIKNLSCIKNIHFVNLSAIILSFAKYFELFVVK